MPFRANAAALYSDLTVRSAANFEDVEYESGDALAQAYQHFEDALYAAPSQSGRCEEMRSAATSSATAAANRVPAPRTSDPGAAAGSCQAGIKPAVASALQALTRNAASLKERGEGRKEGGKGTFGSTCQGASVAGDGLLDRTSAQQSPCAWEGSPAAVLAGLINQQPATSADSQMECDEAMRPTPGLLRRVGSNRQIHLPMEVQAQAWAAWAPHLNVVGKGLYAEGDAFGWHAPVSRSPCTSPKRVGHGSQSVKQSTGEGTGQGLCHRPQGSTVTDSCNAAAAAGTEPLEVAGRPMVFSTYVAPTQQPDKPVATEDLPAAQHVHDSEDEGVQLGPEGEEVFAQHGQLEETLAVQMDAWEEAQTDPWGFGLGTAGGKKGKAQGSTGVRANTAQAGASQQWWQQGTAGAMRMHEAGAVPWHEAGPWAGDQWPGLLRGMDAWATWVPGATGKGEEDADSKAEGAVVGTAGDSGAGETQLVSAAEPSISAACAANTQAAALAPVLVCDERDVRALGVGLPPVGPLASIHHQAVETAFTQLWARLVSWLAPLVAHHLAARAQSRARAAAERAAQEDARRLALLQEAEEAAVRERMSRERYEDDDEEDYGDDAGEDVSLQWHPTRFQAHMDSIRSSSGAAEQAQRLQPASQQPSGVDWHAFFGRSGAAMQQLQPGVLTPQGYQHLTDPEAGQLPLPQLSAPLQPQASIWASAAVAALAPQPSQGQGQNQGQGEVQLGRFSYPVLDAVGPQVMPGLPVFAQRGGRGVRGRGGAGGFGRGAARKRPPPHKSSSSPGLNLPQPPGQQASPGIIKPQPQDLLLQGCPLVAFDPARPSMVQLEEPVTQLSLMPHPPPSQLLSQSQPPHEPLQQLLAEASLQQASSEPLPDQELSACGDPHLSQFPSSLAAMNLEAPGVLSQPHASPWRQHVKADHGPRLPQALLQPLPHRQQPLQPLEPIGFGLPIQAHAAAEAPSTSNTPYGAAAATALPFIPPPPPPDSPNLHQRFSHLAFSPSSPYGRAFGSFPSSYGHGHAAASRAMQVPGPGADLDLSLPNIATAGNSTHQATSFSVDDIGVLGGGLMGSPLGKRGQAATTAAAGWGRSRSLDIPYKGPMPPPPNMQLHRLVAAAAAGRPAPLGGPQGGCVGGGGGGMGPGQARQLGRGTQNVTDGLALVGVSAAVAGAGAGMACGGAGRVAGGGGGSWRPVGPSQASGLVAPGAGPLRPAAAAGGSGRQLGPGGSLHAGSSSLGGAGGAYGHRGVGDEGGGGTGGQAGVKLPSIKSKVAGARQW